MMGTLRFAHPTLLLHCYEKGKGACRMWSTLTIFWAVTSLMTTSVACAVDYPYKKADDFKTLDSFKSIDEFESDYKQYTQHCLDHTSGGSGGVPCFIGCEIWDRELNIYYGKLMKILGEQEKNVLKESQLVWIKERDKTIDFNSLLLDKKYTSPGTMYILMRAGDADAVITPIVKQRALLLKKWLELITM